MLYDLEPITLSIPVIPPSSNNQYKLFTRGGKTYHVASEGLKAYRAQMEYFRLTHLPQVAAARKKAGTWLKLGALLSVHSTFHLDRGRLWTLATKKAAPHPKKMDSSNKLKGLHDVLALPGWLDCDDSYFFAVGAEKATARPGSLEKTVLEIAPHFHDDGFLTRLFKAIPPDRSHPGRDR
jgi:hypothetical protein